MKPCRDVGLHPFIHSFIHSFIHIEHLYSASSRKLLRSAPNTSTVNQSSLTNKVRKNAGEVVLLKMRSSEGRLCQVEGPTTEKARICSGGSRIFCLGANAGGYLCWGGLTGIRRRRRETAIADGKKPLTTRGSGERRKFPSGVWGGAPETHAILNISSENGVHFWILLISHF